MRPVSLRYLRAATSEHHLEAERHVRILDPDATEDGYARFLARMFGFHSAIEDRFAEHAELARAGFDAHARRKQELLLADLRALGRSVDLPRCEDLPRIDTLARALGAAYVIEGSTLGSAFIRAKLSFAPRTHQFLTGYGERTGAMWKQLMAILERELADEDALRDAGRGARATFVALTAWLDEPAREPPHPFRGRA